MRWVFKILEFLLFFLIISLIKSQVNAGSVNSTFYFQNVPFSGRYILYLMTPLCGVRACVRAKK